jgi:predicted DNA binding CopG/RHH family protein
VSVSKAQQDAVHRYVRKKYDRLEVLVPKGEKDAIKDHSAARGESVNGFINRAIHETMERDNIPKSGADGHT